MHYALHLLRFEAIVIHMNLDNTLRSTRLGYRNDIILRLTHWYVLRKTHRWEND
jgi:hypothetical protein